MEINGAQGNPAVFGDGNLLIMDRTGIHAKDGQDAVYLPTGSVEITGIQAKKTYADYSYLPNQVMAERGETFLRRVDIVRTEINRITGGSTTDASSGGNGIFCREFIMNDQNNKSFGIEGGKSSEGKGGYGLIAENIDIDF